jgi:hypothetical protein
MYKSRLTKWGFDQKYKKRPTRFAHDPAIPPQRRPISSVEDQRFVANAAKERSDPSIQRTKSSYQDDGFATGADESSHPAPPNALVESTANANANATEKVSGCSLLTLKPFMQPPAIVDFGWAGF